MHAHQEVGIGSPLKAVASGLTSRGRLLLVAVLLAGALTVGALPSEAKQRPVLGSKDFLAGLATAGFGQVAPRVISNGVGYSPFVKKIRWVGWGQRTTSGHGRGFALKPGGGYYDSPVIVRLRATRLGRCGGSSRPAYTRLRVQKQKKPGSRHYGLWSNWSGQANVCRWQA